MPDAPSSSQSPAVRAVIVLAFMFLLAFSFREVLAGWLGLCQGTLLSPSLRRALCAQEIFSGQRALHHVQAQLKQGDRAPGSKGNAAVAEYIRANLEGQGWSVQEQSFTYRDTMIRNIIGRTNAGRGPVIIMGAHFDTRHLADRDTAHPEQPVPGANDGASGVGVLLELGNVLDLEDVPYELWLAFFDAEDNGGIDGWEWLVGSEYMAAHLSVTPEAMILVDMVGDADQQIYQEANSDRDLAAQIWTKAAELGYGQEFVPTQQWSLLDDHIPFIRRGIPAVDIIDFDYPYWHTTADTLDKVSASSLERVGRTLEAFLERPASP
jgi:glutaminyl-peptide cyclotransferase